VIVRARTILPVAKPPIEDGAVVVVDGNISKVGRWNDIAPDANEHAVHDLGEVILLPGLVNAHCHLDYTDMAGRVPPQKSFVDWIKLITSAKSEWSYTEFAESWLRGARMLLETGTTTVADMEAVPELLPEVWSATPLRVVSFLEMTGVKSRRDPAMIVRDASAVIRSLPNDRCRAGLSPHAPYSTVPELLRLSAGVAREHNWPVCTHVAESRQEFDMFVHARGEMFEWLRRNERDMADCGRGTPVEHLDQIGLLSHSLIAVHANYLADGDADLLGRRGVSVAHCPRSHAYFQHDPFPFRELSRANVNICLGTDSLATVYKKRSDAVRLSMFDEMAAFADKHPDVDARTVVGLATLNGARALGLAGEAGEISPGAYADIIAIPYRGKTADAWSAAVHHKGEIAAGMIAGEWAMAPAEAASSSNIPAVV